MIDSRFLSAVLKCFCSPATTAWMKPPASRQSLTAWRRGNCCHSCWEQPRFDPDRKCRLNVSVSFHWSTNSDKIFVLFEEHWVPGNRKWLSRGKINLQFHPFMFHCDVNGGLSDFLGENCPRGGKKNNSANKGNKLAIQFVSKMSNVCLVFSDFSPRIFNSRNKSQLRKYFSSFKSSWK